MNHGHSFDRNNKADKLHIERKRKEREKRERIEKAAPALLEACKNMVKQFKIYTSHYASHFDYEKCWEIIQARAAIELAEKE